MVNQAIMAVVLQALEDLIRAYMVVVLLTLESVELHFQIECWLLVVEAAQVPQAPLGLHTRVVSVV